MSATPLTLMQTIPPASYAGVAALVKLPSHTGPPPLAWENWLPAAVLKALRPHQVEAVRHSIACLTGSRSADDLGAVVAFSMGLGKTMITLAVLTALLNAPDSPALSCTLALCALLAFFAVRCGALVLAGLGFGSSARIPCPGDGAEHCGAPQHHQHYGATTRTHVRDDTKLADTHT